MPKVSFTASDGSTREVDAKPGDRVMQVATRNGVPEIIGECGGVLSCATCHVFVAKDQYSLIPAPSDLEDELLDGTATDREATSRLSCQISANEDIPTLFVRTPEFQD